MFSPRTPNVKAKASPFMLQKLQKSGKGPTPRTSTRDRNVSSVMNQSLQASQVLSDEGCQKHQIEPFGSPLPVLITEALTLSDRTTTEITACIDPSGWAWLVGGRKLFVWQYAAAKSTRVTQCKELILPPSDLAHSAERVCVIPSERDGQPAACVAVSPEGVVRYWPNIAFESSTAEMNAELKGEECASVINFQPHGCLLATTTSSLLLLQPTPGQTNIGCKPLTSSQGLFSGISRRMSSFIFGASQLQTNGLPLQAVIASPEDEYEDDEDTEAKRSFYVLSGNHLNKWQVPSFGPEKLLYQIDADRLFREAFARKVWDQDSLQLPLLRTWLLDLQLTREGVVILGAGVNQEVAQPVIYYALAYLETYEDAQPANVSDLALMDFTQSYSDEEDDKLTDFKLLSPATLRAGAVFVYNSSSIVSLKDETSDKMDLRTSGDRLLGAGTCNGTAVFFSNTHGIFSVSQPSSEPSFLNESNNQTIMSRAEMSSMVGNISKMADTTDTSSGTSTLKNAFIASISGDQELAQSLVDSLGSQTITDPEAQGSELDHLTTTVSKDLIDDFPTADPRWAETNKNDTSSSTASVIIVQQLKDKQKAHDLFVSFLKKYQLWDQLGIMSVRDTLMPTRLLLCEHVEKLEAAIALRELHAQHHKMIDACMRKVLSQRSVPLPPTLTAQDVFYREASNIGEMLHTLINQESEQLSRDMRSPAVVELVLAVNLILESMLHQALQYRQSHSDMYCASDRDSIIPEYLPWTATADVRKAISQQITVSLERAIPLAREVEVRASLYQQVVGLADVLMDGHASQIESLRCSTATTAAEDCIKLERKFELERQRLIQPLVDHKQFDRAAALAEKFEDFDMLMRICDATDNQDRLQRYRAQFADKGFSQFVFNWYTKEGKRGHLLSQPVSQGEELSKFLDSDNMRYLSWVHEIGQGNFMAAHSSLSQLASAETNFLAKKKTLLSLSKLSALASDDPDNHLRENIGAINEELDLVMYQEQLPSETVENVGMDPENMRVLSPEELIELYVSDKNEGSNELDVKKALDLLRYVDKNQDVEAYKALKLHIWCRAILMDSWQQDDSQVDPMETNAQKIFFRTVDMVHLSGELENLLPDRNTLLEAEELQPLSQQANFQFLMRAGYEQIHSILSTME